MEKKVVWGPPKISSAKQRPGTYRTYGEFLAKANAIQQEQEKAQEFLRKAMPAMVALFEYKLRHNEPLVVMRPLRYQTSELNIDPDDSFYKSSSTSQPRFIDKIKTILPGSQLMLKSLDMSLQEFVFVDAQGNEHGLNFSERDNLLTQTAIYEETLKFLEIKGD